MFTGLVEAVGSVASIEQRGEQARLSIDMPFARELSTGDSVAVNGCCLTVAGLTENGASFDLLAQTLRVTSLGGLSAGSRVNLERAMRIGDRFGGHFVQGHVDATGLVTRLEASGQDHILGVSLPQEIHRLCVDKGSLSVDGISLTIAELGANEAVFWITPHTWEYTHLHAARVGQAVNLEADMLAKHVEKLLAARLACQPSTSMR
jgi:riboflavin synthase